MSGSTMKSLPPGEREEELASRETEDLRVGLYWRAGSNTLRVLAIANNGSSVEIPIETVDPTELGSRALQVFLHPMAYAGDAAADIFPSPTQLAQQRAMHEALD